MIFSNFQGDITVLGQHNKNKKVFSNNKTIIRERKGIKMLKHQKKKNQKNVNHKQIKIKDAER